MKYIKEFEAYKITDDRVYCIYVPNKVNTAFTVGKYYDVYKNISSKIPTNLYGLKLNVKNNNGTLKEIREIENIKSSDFWIDKIIDVLDYNFTVYIIFGSNACFIKSEEVERYNIIMDLNGDAKRYNL